MERHPLEFEVTKRHIDSVLAPASAAGGDGDSAMAECRRLVRPGGHIVYAFVTGFTEAYFADPLEVEG
jgi:hypothetical protein